MANDLRPVNQSVDLSDVRDFMVKLDELVAELRDIFPEREQLIEKLRYAILTREHVLTMGPTGTGKSDLLRCFFGAFEGCVLFKTSLTKFSSESAIFGIPNPKIMREEGKMRYDPAEGILIAHFAEFDEFFDSTAPLQRTLLGVLNEREFKRGKQHEYAQLQSAMASTNATLETEMNRDSTLAAVVDRFLFRQYVDYLTHQDSRLRMYEKYLRGKTPTTVIPYDSLNSLSMIVAGANQTTDPELIVVYDDLIQACRANLKDSKGKSLTISDRRACIMLKIADAEALRNGRYEVLPEDFLAIKHSLFANSSPDELDAFHRIADPIISKAVASKNRQVDGDQIRLLAEYSAKLSAHPLPTDDAELVAFRRFLMALSKDVEAVSGTLATTNNSQQALVNQISATIGNVDDAIKNGAQTFKPPQTKSSRAGKK